MKLSWYEARNLIIEDTEIGWTIASQDKIWIVFIFDTWSEDGFRYNRLYARNTSADSWSYELWDNEPVFTTRAEAEAFAEQVRRRLASRSVEGEEEIPVYVMNKGDDARYERLVIGGYGTPTRVNPKYAGSRAAWDAQIEMSKRWHEHATTLPEQ